MSLTASLAVASVVVPFKPAGEYMDDVSPITKAGNKGQSVVVNLEEFIAQNWQILVGSD